MDAGGERAWEAPRTTLILMMTTMITKNGKDGSKDGGDNVDVEGGVT